MRSESHSPLLLPRGARLLIGAATLFVLLGAGNIVVGRSRAHDYVQLLSKAQDVGASEHSQKRKPQLLFAGENVYTRRIKSRIAFYEMVDLGGRCFLAVAGLLFLASLVPLQSAVRASDADEENEAAAS